MGLLLSKKNILKFLVSIFFILAVGFLGSIFTSISVSTWYPELKKPLFTPPNWIFGPVWTLLYILMGISFYIVWSKTDIKSNKNAFYFFIIQLLLNLLWSFFFFGLKSPIFGLFDIFLLLIFIILTILEFYKISKISAFLMVPYLIWVSFATVLNFSIFILNN